VISQNPDSLQLSSQWQALPPNVTAMVAAVVARLLAVVAMSAAATMATTMAVVEEWRLPPPSLWC